MTDQLSIYNGAVLTHLGEPPLATLDEDRPVRYFLDDIWGRDGVETCLQMGQWNFAARSQRKEFEPSITPDFGYKYAFEKPSDYVRVMGFCSDEYFKNPIRDYHDEAGYWWSHLDTVYVRFVSDDAQYGLDYSKWPKNFTRMVESWFALQVTNVSAYAEKHDKVLAEHIRLLKQAEGTDAMEQPAKENPPGSWSRARTSDTSGDFGSRSRLIG